MQTMKNYILPIALLAAIAAGCDIKPAEEFVEDTGAVAFSAAFQSVRGVDAPWSASDKLMVIDTDNATHRFGMDTGAGSNNGEFSGDITPKTKIKFVAYANDINDISYTPEGDSFTMTIPDKYNAKAAGKLVTANNAAVGIQSGSEVEMKTLCGFIKFTVEANGKTIQKNGETFNLTDLKTVTFTSNDGTAFAGKLTAEWNNEEAFPEFKSISDGSATITFNTRTIMDAVGNIYYEAGDYYIPVAPQEYPDVNVTVEDFQGRKATAYKNRTINVQQAIASNLSSIEWPSVVIKAKFYGDTAEESKANPIYNIASSENLSVGRTSLTTGKFIAGAAKTKTEVPFKMNDMEYSVWATYGYSRASGGAGLAHFLLNNYNASWSYSGDKYLVGGTDGYAWIKIPAYTGGEIFKMVVSACSAGSGPFNVSTSVNPETGAGAADVAKPQSLTTGMKQYTIPIEGYPSDQVFYVCFGQGYTYKVQYIECYYKVYE